MTNSDLEATWAYHDGTKHSYERVHADDFRLDWANQPLPYKIYSSLEPLPLPQDLALPGLPALEAVAWGGVDQADAAQAGAAEGATGSAAPDRPLIPDLRTLAGILYLSGGITKRLRRAGGVMDFRAAACTGALYHIELYLVCGDLAGLAAGVYHFGVHDFALRRLRSGDYRGALVQATGGEAAVASAPVTIVCTTTFWRNAWKYRARAYRHAFWDSGTILANLLAASAGYALRSRVVCGFADTEVNRMLDLDAEREGAVALAPLGWDGAATNLRGAGPGDTGLAPLSIPPIGPLGLPTVPLSKHEVDYPQIRAMHAASSLRTGDEVRVWREGGPAAAGSAAAAGSQSVPRLPADAASSPEQLIPLLPLAGADLPSVGIARVIRRRGSSRRFAREPITFAQLSTMLDRATRGIPADFLGPSNGVGEGPSHDAHAEPSHRAPGEPGGEPAVVAILPATLVTPYLIAHAVEGLAPGAYVFHRDRRALEPLKGGDFRRQAGYLALEQALAADAGANVYFLADLAPILARFGNRGYRAAQLEAAITGGKLYLAAYALGLGATGLTFYDDEVTAFFSPHAAGKSVMFLVALGRPAAARSSLRPGAPA